jgi:hypothetical protein
MSDIEVLEIEIDDTDLIDEPERCIVLQEPEEEPAKRRRITVEDRPVGGDHRVFVAPTTESAVTPTAPPSTSKPAFLRLPGYISRIKRYRQLVTLLYPNRVATNGAPIPNPCQTSTRTVKFVPADYYDD